MVRWLRWHCPPDTGFEIRALAVWGRARYLSVTQAPHNTDFHTWMDFCFFQTAETGNRTPNSGVKGSGATKCIRRCQCCVVRCSGTGYKVHCCMLYGWMNEWKKGVLGHICAYIGNTGHRRMKWMRWHYPSDTAFKIGTLAAWGWARYLTGAPHAYYSVFVVH